MFRSSANAASPYSAASEIVLIEPRTSRMHIILDTKSKDPPAADARSLLETVTRSPKTGRYFSTSIDFVPSQRWVHIAYIVSNNTITTYMDGDIYRVTTHEGYEDIKPSADNSNLVVGGGDPASFDAPVSGFISKVTYFNHLITSKKVRQLYNQTPNTTGLLSWLGLGNWKVRLPFYRPVEDAAATSCKTS